MGKGDGKVRKGLGFYLLLFLFIIIAAVLVCACIMLFNPGKVLLGFEYYSYNKALSATTTNDEQEIKLEDANYSEIIINSNGADVEISNNTDYDKSAVIFVNKAKGFIKAENFVEPTYSVKKDGTKLLVDMKISEGFIKFSKEAKVIIHLANLDNTTAFKNTAFTINSGNGDVNVGGTAKVGYSADIPVKSLSIETTGGDVNFSTRSTNEFSSIYVKTETGIIDFTAFESVKSKDGKMVVNMGKGKLKANAISCALDVTTTNGTVSIGEISGDLNLMGSSAIVDINKVNGNLDLGASSEIMEDCKLKINEITGYVNIPKGEDADINFTKVGGAILIFTTSGNVNIGDSSNLVSSSTNIETESGNVNIYFDNNNKTSFITTKSGNISAYFPSKIGGNKIIKTENGNISVDFDKNSKAKMTFTTFNGSEFDLTKVNMDILNGKNLTNNPYYYNCNESTKTGELILTTNKEITLNLI